MIARINSILGKYKEFTNYNNMIFEKENDILSCIKSVGEEGIRMRQKKAAVSLLELKNKKTIVQSKLSELCKGLDVCSFNHKKMSSKLIATCISEGVTKEDLGLLKEAFKSL